ncbi:hypothetical protein YC2023_023752 [Brassica napus]
MEFGGRWSNKGKGKANESNVLCYCGLVAKSGGECGFFQWFDEGEAFGWQKKALIEARNEIRQKDKTIMGLKKTISMLQSELAKNAEVEEDIINAFLKL